MNEFQIVYCNCDILWQFMAIYDNFHQIQVLIKKIYIGIAGKRI